MRCDDLRAKLEDVEEAQQTESVRAHLEECAGCRTWLEDWRVLRLGFRALAADPTPEPRLGFHARLLRRLEEAADREHSSLDFFERAGRRVVWATLTLALAVLLALALPSSGPLRDFGEPEYLVPQPSMAFAQSEMIVDVDAADSVAPLPAATGRQK
jgi:hypothetical protein